MPSLDPLHLPLQKVAGNGSIESASSKRSYGSESARRRILVLFMAVHSYQLPSVERDTAFDSG
jgi:hypothetical protein